MKKTFFYYVRILSKKIYLYSVKIYLHLNIFISFYFIQSKINAFNEFYLFNDFR